jgi:acetamidase/formamidase
MEALTGRELAIDPTKIHHRWQKDLEPALEISSGDTVDFDLLVAGDPNIQEGMTASDAVFDFETIYNLSGPVYVADAQPGDTLQIEILELIPGEWGWVAILPELGLVPEDFPNAVLKTIDIRNGKFAQLCPGVRIPVSPFLGTMGNHPGEPDGELPFPPHRGGGNMDNRHLTKGSVLYLPVWCPGALFSCGDPHAAQGDGEVCVTALECPMKATLRFTLLKRSIPAPSFRVPAAHMATLEARDYHATSGIATDLMTASRLAVQAMIHWIREEHELSAEDAYMLCSLAADLKILQAVAPPTYNVGLALPLDVFSDA